VASAREVKIFSSAETAQVAEASNATRLKSNADRVIVALHQIIPMVLYLISEINRLPTVHFPRLRANSCPRSRNVGAAVLAGAWPDLRRIDVRLWPEAEVDGLVLAHPELG